MKKLVLALAFVVAYTGLVVWPSWSQVRGNTSGRDFASYHYAIEVARDGGDPYDTDALNVKMRQEGARRGNINPYFYPPPFLLTMAWDEDYSLSRAMHIYYVMNHVFLLGVLAALWRWFSPPLGVLAGVVLTLGALPDDMKMGQANLLVLLLAVVGLWRTNGLALAGAAMAKMSPALYLAWWAVRRQWVPVIVTIAAAIALSIASLPLVSFEHQVRFFTEVLPRFAGGPYHDLTVPITLPANHSIPDLYNQAFPGPDDYTLSRTARVASGLTNLGLLAGLCAVARRPGDTLSDACMAGAFTVLMTITPVYTYEHHLVFMLLPGVALGTALVRGRLPAVAIFPALLSWALMAHPLSWNPIMTRVAPGLSWFVQESKFFGVVGLGLLCAWAAVAGGGAAKGAKGARGAKPKGKGEARSKDKDRAKAKAKAGA